MQVLHAAVRSAHEHGFNTLLVQVRGRGDAYYIGGPEPRAAELHRQPSDFDPLATVLEAAHASGLRVHAWVNVNLVASAADVPTAREHLVHRHPEWLMVPRDIAQELAAIHGKAVPCDFKVPTETSGGKVDTTKVNVQYTAVGAASATTIPQTSDGLSSSCGADPAWYYDNVNAPTLLKMCPTMCDFTRP